MSKQGGQHVKNRHVGMAQLRNVPGKMKVADFYRGFFDNLTRGGLSWFFRQHHWRERSGAAFGVCLPDLANYLGLLHVASDDVKYIVGRVILLVIGPDVVRLKLVENIRVA